MLTCSQSVPVLKNVNDGIADVDGLIEEYEALKISKSFQPLMKTLKLI